MQSQLQQDATQIQIMECTSIFNKRLNMNCFIDGSNIIYIAGSSIVHHNIFQNSKTFTTKLTENQIVGMAFYKSVESSLVLATRSLSKIHSRYASITIEFYFNHINSSKKSVILNDVTEQIQFLDMQFIDKKKVIVLGCTQASKDHTFLLIISAHNTKKIKKIELQEKATKLIQCDRKIYIILSKGMIQFDIESQSLYKEKLFIEHIVENYINIDNQYDIVVNQNNQIIMFSEGKLLETIEIKAYFQSIHQKQSKNGDGKDRSQTQSENGYQLNTVTKIGRSILISFKDELMLVHLQIQNNKLSYLNSFVCPDKLKGNIISIDCSIDEMNLAMAVQIYQKNQVQTYQKNQVQTYQKYQCKSECLIQNIVFNLSALNSDKKFINPFLRMVPHAQMGEISCLQKIIPSEIYYLVGSNIVNYGYLDNVQHKQKYFLHESPKQIYIHPLGHQILCLFENQIKFYQKVQQELIEIWNEQIVCTCASYTENGLLYLSIYQNYYYQLMLYNPNSFQIIHKIKSISIKHPITQIQIHSNQAKILLFSHYQLNANQVHGNQVNANHYHTNASNTEQLLQTASLNINNMIKHEGNESKVHEMKQLYLFDLKSYEKISEYKQRKEILQIRCLEYDISRNLLLLGHDNEIRVLDKSEQHKNGSYNNQNGSFNSKNNVNSNNNGNVDIVFSEERNITMIHIHQSLQLIFIGTADGKVLFAPYPLLLVEITQNISNTNVNASTGTNTNMDYNNQSEVKTLKHQYQKCYRIQYKTLKISYQPIINMLVTNNCKYMFVTLKDHGLVIAKIKKPIILNGKSGYNPYDVSSYNFVESSNHMYLINIHEKLKHLLQKRKATFLELEEFKKQWENKKQQQHQVYTTAIQQQQLLAIQNTLDQITNAKKRYQKISEELTSYDKLTNNHMCLQQNVNNEELLQFYHQNDDLKQRKQAVQIKCNAQYQNITNECKVNLQEIKEELQQKYKMFNNNYVKMRDNLISFQRKVQIQQQEQVQIELVEDEQLKQKLSLKQDILYKYNNQLKSQITKNKKEQERFLNRKDFLENKKRFFLEQLTFSKLEKSELLQVKQHLEQQLTDLEDITFKKEKRLKKYFIQNQILIKYQQIHDNLTTTTNRQIDFLENQKHNFYTRINAIQSEISIIAQEKDKIVKTIKNQQNQFQNLKNHKRDLKNKYEYLELFYDEISNNIEEANSLENNEKITKFVEIYKKYYMEKKLEEYINRNDQFHSNTISKGGESYSLEKQKNQTKIKEILKDHQEYLTKNMKLFEKHNMKTLEEINLNYLKCQNQNYNLIAECNIRKEQTNKKKRILHQLIDSVRETQKYMVQVQKENQSKDKNAIHQKVKRRSQDISFKQGRNQDITLKEGRSTPFLLYEKQVEEERFERNGQFYLTKEKSQSTEWKIKKSGYQVRKMLEIQKIQNLNNSDKMSRRIKTAMIKKKTNGESSHEQVADQSLVDQVTYFKESIKKPMTAAHNKRYKLVKGKQTSHEKNKSSSKPTTCTTHTKGKSIAI